MFDFMRDRQSAEDKRLEALGAYLDNALTTAERERFEGRLRRDPSLRADLEQMRVIKLQMRAMPRRRAPRSFALDPALYGRPKAQPAMQLYPVLRGATALTAFFLIFTLALGAFRGQFAARDASAPTETSAIQPTAEESVAIEAAEEAAPLMEEASPASQDRVGPTDMPEAGAAPAEAPAKITEQEAITEEFAIEAMPPVEGTLVPEGDLPVTSVPGTELALEATAPAAATVEAVAEAMETSVAAVELPANETVDSNIATDSSAAADTAVSSSMLQPIQIGLGIAFLLSLVLWLIVRRRVRSF